MKRVDIPNKQISNDSVSIAISKLGGSINMFEYYYGITIELLKYKNENHTPFTKNDLIYLYDIYNLMPQNRDNEILKYIRLGRDIVSDMATIFDCSLDEVAASQNELKKDPSKYVVLLDDFDMGSCDEFGFGNKYPRLKYIMGICHAFFCTELDNTFPVLEAIGSNLDLYNITNSVGLENLKSIGGHATFNYLYSVTNLCNLVIIGGDARFPNLKSSKGLEKLFLIGGHATFNILNDATGLCNLEMIGGTARFHSLRSAKGLEKLRYIGLIANFDRLESMDGLSNLEYIGELESSYFNSLPTIEREKIKTRVRTK